jgi:hypothetical protein
LLIVLIPSKSLGHSVVRNDSDPAFRVENIDLNNLFEVEADGDWTMSSGVPQLDNTINVNGPNDAHVNWNVVGNYNFQINARGGLLLSDDTPNAFMQVFRQSSIDLGPWFQSYVSADPSNVGYIMDVAADLQSDLTTVHTRWTNDDQTETLYELKPDGDHRYFDGANDFTMELSSDETTNKSVWTSEFVDTAAAAAFNWDTTNSISTGYNTGWFNAGSIFAGIRESGTGGFTLTTGANGADAIIKSLDNAGNIILNDDVGSSGGVVIHGTAHGVTIGGTAFDTHLIVHDDQGTGHALLALDKNTDTPGQGATQLFLRSRGTEASPTVVADNDVVARIVGAAYDGTDHEFMAEIVFEIDDPTGVSGSSMGGAISFFTTADGSTSMTERMRIENDAKVDVAQTMTIGSSLSLEDPTGDTITQQANATTTSYTVTWPAAQGGAGTNLQNDGAGNLSWVAGGGGGGNVSISPTTGNTDNAIVKMDGTTTSVQEEADVIISDTGTIQSGTTGAGTGSNVGGGLRILGSNDTGFNGDAELGLQRSWFGSPLGQLWMRNSTTYFGMFYDASYHQFREFNTVAGGQLGNFTINENVFAFNTSGSTREATIDSGGLRLESGNSLELESPDGTDTVSIVSQNMAADYTLTLPNNDGSADEVLTTDGSGNLSWSAPPGQTVQVTDTDVTVNNSTTLVSTGLTFVAESNSDYSIDGYLFTRAFNGTPDFRFAITAPAGSTCDCVVGNQMANDFERVTACGGLGTGRINHGIAQQGVQFSCSVDTAGSSSAVTIQFAQFAAHTSNTVVQNGSHMQWQKE